MALVNTSEEWGNDTIRYRNVQSWVDGSKTIMNDVVRTQVKVRDPIITAGLLGAITVTYTAWSDWKDFEYLPVADIVR